MQFSKQLELPLESLPIEDKKHALPQMRIMEFGESQFDLSSPLLLSDSEIHLWRSFTQTFESRGKELEMLLSGEELDRVERFYFQKDRIRFIVAHGILKMIVGRYLNMAPCLVSFRSGFNGKPELPGYCDSEAFSFNISHSYDLTIFAFSKFRSLGVDVEHIRHKPDFYEIADYYFHPKERAALQRLSLCNRKKAFFEYWTRKEAFVKATGEGLSRPLDSFFISIGSEKKDGILSVGGDGIRAANWNLLTFRPAQGYAGAVAFES
jgi:4'-phosphopantetheinyl transferase